MAKIDVKEQLKTRFAAPLQPGADRRIVIWHDEAAEFEDAFDVIAAATADSDDAVGGSDRELRFVKALGGSMFEAKYLINVGDTTSDLLVYRQRPAGDLAGDWLADVELYAESFQADMISMLAESLGVVDSSEVRAAIADHRPFFGSKTRNAKFTELMPHAASRGDVLTGMFAVLLGCDEPKSEDIVRAYALALDDGDYAAQLLESFEKYGLTDAFASYLRQVTGYEGALDDQQQFMTNLLLSAFSDTVPESAMEGLVGKYSPDCATYCLNIVHDWMEAGDDARSALYDAARAVESRENLAMRFDQLKPEALMRSDIFPAIDEVLARGLLVSLGSGSDRRAEAREILGARRNLTWSRNVRHVYDFIEIAVDMRDFHEEHLGGFGGQLARDVFNSYKNDWYRMDYLYRRFCEAYDRVDNNNPALIDDAQKLFEWGDNLYVNWFLTGVNTRWVETAASGWEQSGYVEGVPRQRHFYSDVVVPELKRVKRVAVIISDAMRYAVAAQLEGRLERKTSYATELSAMQAQFPSITSYGMAALLPNNKISLDANGNVLVDGMKTISTEQRQAVLDRALPGSRAITYDSFKKMRPQERKELAEDAPVIYVYHNTIDATGEKAATQGDVFEACEHAVEDIFGLAKILIGSMGVSRVIVTADHGFLYTFDNLQESDKIPSLEVGKDAREITDRYALLDHPLDSDLFVQVAVSAETDEDLVGIIPRGFAFIKRPGGGRYAHGGMSLEEVCVPVLKIKPASKREGGSVETLPTKIQLLDTTRRVTSMLFGVRLYQPDPVSSKVAPCEYELLFVDGAGNQVSDVRHAMADRSSEDPTERQFELRFSLKEGRTYSAADSYYLIARRVDDGAQLWREEYTIDIAFAPTVDFGF